MRLFSYVQANTLCRYGSIYFLDALVLVCVDVMVMHLRTPRPEPVHWVVVSVRCKC